MDLVFYFSGTGNSFSVAKALSDNSIDIAAAKPGEFKADTIGFVFPVYCYLQPEIVTEFIKKSKFETPYIWAVATCGGGAGASLGKIHKLLKKCGGLSYATAITLPDNCIIFKTSDRDKERLLGNELKITSAIKADINNRIKKPPKLAPFAYLTGKLSWFGIKYIYGAKKPRSNEKCTQCGLCVRLCPTDNISTAKNGVMFDIRCQYCFGCIHFCPSNAIEFGKIKRADGDGYKHPNVSSDDLIKPRKI